MGDVDASEAVDTMDVEGNPRSSDVQEAGTYGKETNEMTVLLIIALLLGGGAVYNEDGTCTDAEGNPGVWSVTPPCYTAEVYDEAFSVENLAEVYGDEKVETWNLDPTIQPSERLLGVGLVREPFTFRDYVAAI
jgi:hypothetical protein